MGPDWTTRRDCKGRWPRLRLNITSKSSCNINTLRHVLIIFLSQFEKCSNNGSVGQMRTEEVEAWLGCEAWRDGVDVAMTGTGGDAVATTVNMMEAGGNGWIVAQPPDTHPAEFELEGEKSNWKLRRNWESCEKRPSWSIFRKTHFSAHFRVYFCWKLKWKLKWKLNEKWNRGLPYRLHVLECPLQILNLYL